MDDSPEDQITTMSQRESDPKLHDALIRAQRLESICALIAQKEGEALFSLPRLQRSDILDEISDKMTDIRCRIQDAIQ